MKLKGNIKSAMEQLKIDTLRKHQLQPINCILGGQDTLVIAPTGFRKIGHVPDSGPGHASDAPQLDSGH